jgi:cell division protein FtsB
MEHRAPVPSSPEPDEPNGDGATASPTAPGSQGIELPDLSALPVAGVTRRRLAFLLASICAAWIVIVFARQVGETAAAASRLEAIRAQNAALTAELAALEAEYELIQQDAYIVQQGHAHRLGRPGEIAVTRARPVQLPANAPGSAALRLGAEEDEQSPLESWLELLFGPSG